MANGFSASSDNGRARLIYNQRDEQYAGLRYGIGRFAFNGCEIAAVYNALVLTGVKPELEALIGEFSSNGAMWLRGLWGTRPRRIGRYFDAHGIPYRRCATLAETEPALGEVCLLSFWNGTPPFRGIHTVAVYNENGRIFALNRHYSSAGPAFFGSVAEVLGKKDRFITGYRLAAPAKKNG